MNREPMCQTVPFYSQDWNLTQWRSYGFDSFDDAQYWKYASCGALCVKMAVDSLKGEHETLSISDFIKEGTEIGAYTHATGWSHTGLAELARQHGLNSLSQKGLSIRELRQILQQGCLVVVSIKTAFSTRKSMTERLLFWKKTGGHLALVVGYTSEGFIVHHTSVTPEWNWKYALIPYDTFTQSFTGRGIVVCSPRYHRQ